MPGLADEKRAVLTSPTRPLFNRALGGLYSPGSTIKPLVGVAALKEGVISSDQKIFSPGYIDIPNPYFPDQPTRYEDWRYQGWVNLAAAIAQSSDVYFYLVGGGSPVPSHATPTLDGQGGIHGLGIARLNAWWQKFNLGSLTNIDLPGEAKGLLPNADEKGKSGNRPWLLGDTYNVSIGQGNLLLTPVQLISYIGAIANTGKVFRPFLAKTYVQPQVLQDLTDLAPQIKEVQQGMLQAVQSSQGTAFTLKDLPFSVGAKTGSAQIKNNAQENAFFVGYAPADTPQIAILVLIENSKEGSLNAVPIAKDVLNWYYTHRLKK
jgi:penicillin-binding protein 2